MFGIVISISCKRIVPRFQHSSMAVVCFINYLAILKINFMVKRPSDAYGIRVATKPLLTLEQMLPSPKDRPPSEEQTNVIYRINCADCSWSNIGETGRAFITRKKEHMKNVEKHKAGSNIAKNAWSFDHKIDFQNCKIIDKANCRHRATPESWHTALTTNADNNSKHLPEQYRFLLKK